MSGESTCSTPHAHQLSVNQIDAHYDKKVALQGIDFAINCGKRLALIGPNGAGKSTLIRILAGLKNPTKGSVTWRGQLLAEATHEVAYLPQLTDHSKQFPISVREVVEMGRFPHVGHWRKFRELDIDKVDSALRLMEIEKLADRQVDQLSGGQQQRMFIARALAQEAHVILLDEPFNGLDVESRLHLVHTIKQLSESGHLIIASHHNLETLEEIYNQVLVLNEKQIAFGSTHEVMSKKEVNHLFSCSHFHDD